MIGNKAPDVLVDKFVDGLYSSFCYRQFRLFDPGPFNWKWGLLPPRRALKRPVTWFDWIFGLMFWLLGWGYNLPSLMELGPLEWPRELPL